MNQIIQNYKSGELKVEDVPVPLVKPGDVLVRNINSLISAGTEKSTADIARKNLIAKAKDRPDQAKKVIKMFQNTGLVDTIKMVKDRLNSPIPLGYSCAGVVIETGVDVDEFQVGDRVACAGANYASHAEVVWVPKNLCVNIPKINCQTGDTKYLPFEEAAFVTLGAIAMQGIRQADVKLSEKVAVIGLGLLGQITVQLLKASGCEVIGSDLELSKLKLSAEFGADSTVMIDKLRQECIKFTNGRGVDAVIITAATRSNQPIEIAGEIARKKGKVVVVGRIGMNVPRDLYYHKELDIRLSTSYGPGRYDKDYEEKGRDYPYGYVRWTEKRNMESFLSLIAHQKVNVKKLITHRFNIEQAAKAYDMILDNTEPYLGVILEYSNNHDVLHEKLDRKTFITSSSQPLNHCINIGIIGCGNYARGVLVPKIMEFDGVNIKAVCTETSISAKSTGDKLKCDYCTTDYREILCDNDIHAVIIATRHNSHTQNVIDAFKAGKHIFVEKPLAISELELKEVTTAYYSLLTSHLSPKIMVGFNRRFSPHAIKVFDHFKDRKNPLVMNYRINAGSVARDHWSQDVEQGGGRIIGEVCHFIDFFQFISNAEPKQVYAQQIGSHTSGITNDNCLITIKFSDGSIGSISYIASGDTCLSKEHVEIFGDGRSAVIRDFKKTELYANNRKKTFTTRKQDKGHKGELVKFFNMVRNGKTASINFESLYLTTLTTFKVHESLNSGMAISVN